MKRYLPAFGLLLTVIPTSAWACPVCAGRESNTGLVATLLGLMIAVPYAISVVVIRTIRKADKDSVWQHDGTGGAAEAPR